MTITGVLVAIVVGAVIGALARLVLPGRQNIGILLTIAIGIAGAVIGTAIAQAVGVATTKGIDWIELVLQVVVAAIGIAIVSSVRGGSRSRI